MHAQFSQSKSEKATRIVGAALSVSAQFWDEGYDFTGPTRFDKLFTGIAVETPAYIKASKSRRGFEDTTPEDTFDGDYGRLLDQMAQTAREGWRPQRELAICCGLNIA